MMTELTAVETVRQAVASWEGVTIDDHCFGGVEFRLGRRELGRLQWLNQSGYRKLAAAMARSELMLSNGAGLLLTRQGVPFVHSEGRRPK